MRRANKSYLYTTKLGLWKIALAIDLGGYPMYLNYPMHVAILLIGSAVPQANRQLIVNAIDEFRFQDRIFPDKDKPWGSRCLKIQQLKFLSWKQLSTVSAAVSYQAIERFTIMINQREIIVKGTWSQDEWNMTTSSCYCCCNCGSSCGQQHIQMENLM